jgi:hypothetical protein
MTKKKQLQNFGTGTETESIRQWKPINLRRMCLDKFWISNTI